MTAQFERWTLANFPDRRVRTDARHLILLEWAATTRRSTALVMVAGLACSRRRIYVRKPLCLQLPDAMLTTLPQGA